MGLSWPSCGSVMARWPLLIVVLLALVVSETTSFQDRIFHHRRKISQRERRQQPACISRHTKRNNILPFPIFAGTVGDIEVEEKAEPTRQNRKILSDPPSSISRRSAATIMATTSSSVLFSLTTALPAVAAEEAATPVVGDSKTTTDALLDASMDDTPVAKEKTFEYNVQDFSFALPANWKVITKYDEKSNKASSTPTLFSAIDFNSGAVISIVKEGACSVSDYAKSSFEKSKKNDSSNRCDFVLKNTNEDGLPQQQLFSDETFEKDASKLLTRHDDRDNAVLRGVSKIEESMLSDKGGRRLRPLEALSLPTEVISNNSYSTSLLELRAMTTIPTGGTYRDTMGLDQPNTIDRKVLAKAVATTTRTVRKVEPTAKVVSPPSNKSTMLATETEEKAKESTETTPELLASTKVDLSSAKTTAEGKAADSSMSAGAEDTPTKLTAEATKTTTSEKEAVETKLDVSGSATVSPTETQTVKVTASTSEKKPENDPNIKASAATASTETVLETAKANQADVTNSKDESITTAVAPAASPETKATKENSHASGGTILDQDVKTAEKKTEIAALPAQTKSTETIIPEPVMAAGATTSTTSTTSEPGPSTKLDDLTLWENVPSASTAKNSSVAAMMAMVATIIEEPPLTDSGKGPKADTALNIPSTEATVEKAKEKAIETVIEEVKEISKEKTKEVAMKMPTETAETGKIASAVTGSTINPEKPIAASEEPQQPRTTEVASKSDAPAETIAPKETTQTASDDTLVASTTPSEGLTATTAHEPLTVTTTTTTVLSLWLSAPLDEWQKPVMGTRLNQIWDSIQYTNNIIEDSDDLSMLSSDEDLNRQLLLLNKRAFP